MTNGVRSGPSSPTALRLNVNPNINLLCVWTGPCFVVLYSVGFLVAGLFPPPVPTLSTSEIVALYGENATGMRIGCILMATGAAFFAPWAAAVVTQLRRSELGSPVLTYTTMTGLFFVAMLASVVPTVWIAATYRAGQIAPDVTVALHDLGWFLFLFPWQLAAAGVFIPIGLSILTAGRGNDVYPRWLGWTMIWFCLLSSADSLFPFFKSGPFATNGLFVFYFPFAVLLAFVICMTWATVRAINRQKVTEGSWFTPVTSNGAGTGEASLDGEG